MTKTKYHEFEVGCSIDGQINLRDGSAQFKHESVSPTSNYLGIGVYHVYNSIQDNNTTTDNLYGRRYTIELEPKYDPNPENQHDIYRDGKAVVEKTGDRYVCIKDKNGNVVIKFNYTTSNRLDSITHPDGTTKIEYTSTSMPTGLVSTITHINSTGPKTLFNYINTNYIEKIVNPSLNGIQLIWTSKNEVKSIKDITYMQSLEFDQYSPNSVILTPASFSIIAAPYATDNEVTFTYNDSITTKLDVKSGIKTEYTHKNAGDITDGLIKEETTDLNNNVITINYSRKVSNDEGVEIIDFIKNDVILSETEYRLNTDLDEVYRRVNEMFRTVDDGVQSQTLKYKNTTTINTYTDRKLTKIETGGAVVSSPKTSIIYSGFKATDFQYESIPGYVSKKLTKITHSTEMIEEFFYTNGEVTKIETYYKYDPGTRQCYTQNFENNYQQRLNEEFDDSGRLTAAYGYCGNTQRVTSRTAPGGTNANVVTNYNFDPYSKNLLGTSIKVNGETNQNNLSYVKDYLVRVSGGKQNYDFEYHSKPDNDRPRQVIKIDGAVYAVKTQKEEKNQEGKVVESTNSTRYSNGEEIEIVKNDNGITNIYYYPVAENAQPLMTLSPNSVTDHITNETTMYTTDEFDSVIATESESLKTTITISNPPNTSVFPEVVGSKFVLKNLGITQNYGYAQEGSGDSAVFKNVTLPTGAEEFITYNRRVGGGINSISSSILGETSFSYLYSGLTFQHNGTRNYASSLVRNTYDITGSTSCAYSNNGSISYIGISGCDMRYVYDDLNRLMREERYTQQEGSKVTTFDYDANGNIKSKTIYTYGIGETVPIGNLTNGTTILYNYITGTDKLLDYNGEQCAYDSLGNPITYRGARLEWERIRNLTSIDDGRIKFKYNGSGLRTTKLVDSTDYTHYIWADSTLIAETRGVEIGCGSAEAAIEFSMGGRQVIEYFYGVNGITGFRVNGTPYYYRKNLQGDITHIYTADAQLVGQYRYSAFGECETLLDENGIASLNPIRYRGYYYDVETGLYYLKSRYYDPEVGRFISPDKIENILAESTLAGGVNLYQYCYNNPVMFADPSGEGFLLMLLLGLIIGAVIAGVKSDNKIGSKAWWRDVGKGALIGAAVGGALGALGGLAFAGAGTIGGATGGGMALAGGGIAGAGAAITGTQALSIVGALGLVMFAEHTKNQRKSNWDKHSGRRSGGPEKKDPRMKYKKWKRPKGIIPFLPFLDWIWDQLDD